MKKLLSIFLILTFCSFIFGCGNPKTINEFTYDTYGLFNETDKKNEKIEYRIIIGNIVWSVILVETIIAPIYFLGFSLFEPIGLKDINVPKGTINHNKLQEPDTFNGTL